MKAPRGRRDCLGIAAVEFALLLPLLLLLALPLVDAARALQAQLILTNMAREGANLAARGPAPNEAHAAIFTAVTASAPPLNMSGNGVAYITIVTNMGTASDPSYRITEQYRSGQPYAGAPGSRLWNACGEWQAGRCASISSAASPLISIPAGTVGAGQQIFAMETFYNFNSFFGGWSVGPYVFPVFGPHLYARSIF